MEKKYSIRAKRNNEMERADLRIINEGISISNEYKSILIGYNEVTGLSLDEKLFLNITYTKESKTGKYFGNEILECSDEVMKELSKKTRKKINKISKSSNGLIKDSVIFVGKCRYNHVEEECTIYITHKKIILLANGQQISFELMNIQNLERTGSSGLKFYYGQEKYEFFSQKIEQIIMYIEQNRLYACNYDDNVDLSTAFNVPQKKKSKKRIIIIILMIIIAAIAVYFFVLNK